MPQIEPWEKVRECSRALQITTDFHRKDILSNLQDMWIALANEERFLSPEQWSREIDSISRLHVSLMDVSHASPTRHSLCATVSCAGGSNWPGS
jgi:hypothetical protein